MNVTRRCFALLSVVSGTAIAFVGGTQSSVMFARQVPAAETDVRKIHVKFLEGTDADQPFSLLSPQLASAVADISRLFSLPPAELSDIRTRGSRRSGEALPNLNLWFQVTVHSGINLTEVVGALNDLPSVEIAHVASTPKSPPRTTTGWVPQRVTPSFMANQGYLDAAPEGIAARFAWTIPGGNGDGVTIYDVEYNWNQHHEDLRSAKGTPLLLDPGDVIVDPFADPNHGTAVLGEMIGTRDKKGVTGVAWGADVGLAPANTLNRGYNVANAILLAVANGSAGDVILIEQQQYVCGLPMFGPPEVDISVFAAIQTAVTNGFVVVETAGNGDVDLDQPSCGSTFDRTVRDSGAILVGAGLPPGSGADRHRAGFSAYGSRIDVQGWGTGVTTTGYGDLYRNPDTPNDPKYWYTFLFSGTSSAASMVAGAAANLQGIARQEFSAPLTSLQIRRLLKRTGSRQLGNTAEHIGPRPNLRKAINQLFECFEAGFDRYGQRRVVRRPHDESPNCLLGRRDRDYPKSVSGTAMMMIRGL